MLLDRYLIREISASFVAVAIVLTVVFLAYSLTRFLTDAASGLLKAADVAQLTFYKSVIALEVLLPLALYLGLIIGFGRLNASNELTAMRAGGLPDRRMLRPVLAWCLLLATLVGTFSVNIRPWAYSAMFALRDSAEASSELDRIKPQRFYLYEGGERTVYIERIARNGVDLNGIFIRTHREIDDELEIITAPSGHLEAFATRENHRLTLAHARIYRMVPDGNDLYANFDSLTLSLDALKPVDEQYRSKAAATTALFSSNEPSDRAELQWRLSTPLSTLLLTLVAFTMTSYRPRQSRFSHVPVAIGVYAVYYNLLGVARTWVEQQTLQNLWWVPALLAIALAVHFLFAQRRALPA